MNAVVPPPISEAARLEMISGHGTKDDAGKTRFSLVPVEALTAIAGVFTYGAKKYSEDNWRNGMSWRRMLDPLKRHIAAWEGGEDLDPESGYHHLAHAGCCLMMLLTYCLLPNFYREHDDRWKRPAKRVRRK